MKIKVKFLINETREEEYTREVFAFFPDEQFTNESFMRTSYSHIGQHSACHIKYAKESREATKDEYESLMNELVDIGYELEILNN